MITKVLEPGKNWYYIKHKNYTAIIRALNGHDLERATGLDLNTLSGVQILYKSLLIKENISLLELDLEECNFVLKEVKKTIFKYLIPPQNWLTIVCLISGRKFTPDWRQWLDTPIEDLFAMVEVYKTLEQPSL
jgi:hypothetical protein